jgi:hypothetical protein
MATGWPTLPNVRTFLRLQPDPVEDQVIGWALASAIDYGNRRTSQTYAAGGFLPDLAFDACLMHAARLYRRRDSIDGTLGFGDMGVVRVGRADPDIDAAYASIGPVVFG